MLLKIQDTKTYFPIITFKLVLDRLQGEMKSQKVTVKFQRQQPE